MHLVGTAVVAKVVAAAAAANHSVAVVVVVGGSWTAGRKQAKRQKKGQMGREAMGPDAALGNGFHTGCCCCWCSAEDYSAAAA